MAPFLLILLLAISLGAAGQILLKAGLSQLPENSPPVQVLSSIFTNARVFFGFACYGLSSLVYLIALKRLPLSYAYPMVALSYVMVVALSWKVFGESIPPLRIVAVAIILAGVVMLALSYDAQASGSPAASPPAAMKSGPGSGSS
jgi:multidrug transporter EmrE-like cation transporter